MSRSLFEPNGPSLILVLEDDANDLLILREAFMRNGITTRIEALPNGQEGIDYMSGEGKYADRTNFPMPSLVLLDLKMPRKTGLEFLAWVRERPEMMTIPTIVLSASAEATDVREAYRLGATSYFAKPSTFDELRSLVATLCQYWNLAVRPSNEPL